MRVGDRRHPVLHVLVALAVVGVGAGLDDLHLARAVLVLGILERHRLHHARELGDGVVVARVADVVDLAARHAARVGDDLHQGVDAVVDVGEGALLLAAVDQLDRLAAHDVAQELGDHARAAFLRRAERVEPGADPVEGPEQGEIEALLRAVGPDHAVHQLLGAGVDPALLVDRPQHQLGGLGIELAVAAHAVDLRGRGEDQALAVLDAGTHDRQIGLEVELEHAQRLAHVGGRRGDRHQRDHRVALADVVLDPLLVDRDVALEEVKARVGEQVRDALGLHVHAVDVPVGGLEHALREVVADEAVDAEDQEFFHEGLLLVSRKLRVAGRNAPAARRRRPRGRRARMRAAAAGRPRRSRCSSAPLRSIGPARPAAPARAGSTRVRRILSGTPRTAANAPG